MSNSPSFPSCTTLSGFDTANLNRFADANANSFPLALSGAPRLTLPEGILSALPSSSRRLSNRAIDGNLSRNRLLSIVEEALAIVNDSHQGQHGLLPIGPAVAGCGNAASRQGRMQARTVTTPLNHRRQSRLHNYSSAHHNLSNETSMDGAAGSSSPPTN